MPAATTGSEVQVQMRRSRHRLSSAHTPHSLPVQACNPLPSSLAALDLSAASPAPVLASVRVLVLSHLAELERRLAPSDSSTSESWKSKGEETVEDARVWAREAIEMLRGIRSDVCSHLPELPFDATSLEELLKTHFHDLFYPALMDDIRSHLPELPRPYMPDFNLPDVQSRLQDVRSHLPEMPVDFNQPMSYLPTLSHHLNSLHAHLSDLNTCSGSLPSLPSTSTLSDLLDRLLSSNLVPAVLHRADGQESALEKAAKDMSKALKKSLDGAELVTYVDLPNEWRNNPWVVRGYRFIPLNKWPIILLSLFAIHNETLNIHTHMIPLLHTALRFLLNYASDPLDRPEKIYTAFAMLCLFSSVVWHTMSGCAHRQGMELCARVDYVGIGWLISASVGTVVYYGFSCHRQAALIYTSLCLVTGIAGSIFPFMTWFNGRKYKPVRVVFFVGMALTGLAPIAHFSYYIGFWAMLSFIQPIMPSLSSYIIGLIFYVTHVPERFIYSERISRWTDWLGGGSHAIWHAFIALAIYQHKWGMREMRASIGGERCLLS
ncbi:HlyIII-domain-containing protein [Phellopilus nigrolimitatus]|nr:HlyIII-domain-containing protein [Phellopilus nigrolimitatus]